MTASPSKAILNKPSLFFVLGELALEIIVAAATWLSIASFTSSKLLDKKR